MGYEDIDSVASWFDTPRQMNEQQPGIESNNREGYNVQFLLF